MRNIFNQLDPTFVAALYGTLVHQVARLTQDKHGKTRPFVIFLCVGFGFAVTALYSIFGYETVWSMIGRFLEHAGVALAVASTIWLFTQKATTESKKLK